jgi:hypothetical protein
MMTQQERTELLTRTVERGPYSKLYHKLKSLPETQRQWQVNFQKIEQLIAPRKLPKSARLYRPWWANDTTGSHTHALSWDLAGWQTSQVDLVAETLVFVRASAPH